MLLRRVSEHLKTQNWMGVLIDFVIVVLGVFVGLQAQEWSSERDDRHRLERIISAIKADMADSRRVESRFGREIRAGLNAFREAYQHGKHPPPFVYRIGGADTAPSLIWGALEEAGLGELIDPQLLFELNFFYSERAGIGEKITRYMESIEQEVLPYLHGDPGYFYDETGEAMRPQYLATMERLSEWAEYLAALAPWSDCLEKRLETASEPGESCRSNYHPAVAEETGANAEAEVVGR